MLDMISDVFSISCMVQSNPPKDMSKLYQIQTTKNTTKYETYA